ncbi:hypothetical protein H072_8568 [Dactylellina haptotyla CBS 200.50]|uniref:Mid2 domain-containing protein n=1 Tax=Dactylellina haptotyla (strain CBS 200.50) TaxID=1284197 RepID=S8BR06_DACHA|nr:hypothetical protein H072_8568 [Dactylellina haptotyla CBS 200.50]
MRREEGGCCPLGQVCISPSGCQDYVPPVSATSEPAEPTTVIRTEFQVSTIVRPTTVSNKPSPTTPASPSETLQTPTAPPQVTQGGNSSADATTSSTESTQGTVASNVGGMPTGVIVGIAIGCSLVSLLVGGLLLFCLFQRWKRKQGGAGRRSSVAKPPQELHGSSYLDPNFTAPDRYGNSGWGPSEYSTQSQQTWHELSATPRVPQVQSDNSQELGGLDTQR